MMRSVSQRVTTVFACALIQMLLGSVYAWSVLATSLESAGLRAWQTQLIFGLTIAVFAVTTWPAGLLVGKLGARTLMIAAGALFAAGHIVAGYGGASFPLLLVGLSIIAAIGIGSGYMSAIISCTSCYPQRRGMATGVAVAGFGAGAILHSRFAGWLLSHGFEAGEVLRLGGLAAGVLVIALAFAVRPPVLRNRTADHLPMVSVLSSTRFHVGAVGMFLGCFGGLLLVGSLSQFGADAGLTAADTLHAITAFAIGNILGRLGWGLLYDRFSFPMIPASLLMAACAKLLIYWSAGSASWFVISAALAGVAFGGNFSLYAAYLAQAFGSERLTRTYPFVFMCYGFSALVGPTVGGALRDYTNSPAAGVWMSVIAAGLGFAMVQWLHARAESPATCETPELTRVG